MAYNSSTNQLVERNIVKTHNHAHNHAHAHVHDHQPLRGDGQKRFLEFIKRVSPEADPKSVLLFVAIMHARNHLSVASEKNLGTAGLSWPKLRMLMSLQRQEQHGDCTGMQPSELSSLQGISRNTASALIAGLEEDGLISRELHETDRRKFLIRLTPEGRKVLKSKMDSHFCFLTRCFGGFTPAERQTLLDLLTRLNETLTE